MDDSSAPPIVPQGAHSLSAPAAGTAGEQREVIVQACAMAVADAVAHLRNAEIIATAVVGAATERIMLGVEANQAQMAIESAQNSVLAAAHNFQMVAQLAAQALENFPAPSTDEAPAPPPA